MATMSSSVVEREDSYYIGSFAIIADPQFGLLKPQQDDWSSEIVQLNDTINAINLLRDQPSFVAFVGDLTHAEPLTPKKEAQIADFRYSVNSLRARPFFLCGNHDIGDNPSLNSLRAYRASFGPDYYSFDNLESKFIFLNSQLFFGYPELREESAMQWEWLNNLCRLLEMQRYRHVFVLQHVPPFIDAIDEAPKQIRNYDMTFNLPDKRERAELLSTVRMAGAFRFFCGHLHRNANSRDGGFEVIVTDSTTSTYNNGYRLVRVFSDRIMHTYITVPSRSLPNSNTSCRRQWEPVPQS